MENKDFVSELPKNERLVLHEHAPLPPRLIFNIIREINDKGTTILLVEQNAKRALSIADRAYVLETGRITLEGTGEELASDERVQKAYLGG